MADWGQNEREIVNSVILSVCRNKHQAKNVIAQFQEFLFYLDVIHCVTAFKKLDQEGKFAKMISHRNRNVPCYVLRIASSGQIHYGNM